MILQHALTTRLINSRHSTVQFFRLIWAVPKFMQDLNWIENRFFFFWNVCYVRSSIWGKWSPRLCSRFYRNSDHRNVGVLEQGMSHAVIALIHGPYHYTVSCQTICCFFFGGLPTLYRTSAAKLKSFVDFGTPYIIPKFKLYYSVYFNFNIKKQTSFA